MNQITTLLRHKSRRILLLSGFFVLAAAAACLWFIPRAQSADIFSIVYANPSGVRTLSSGAVTIDISNANQGYIMVRHSGSSKRLKTKVIYNGAEALYDQNNYGEYETFPLMNGSGEYTIQVFENTKGSSYTRVYNNSFYADVPNPNAAFMCPNKYVWYTPTTLAIAKSFELCDGLSTDMEKAKALYKYVGETIMYDYIKASSARKGYMPDINETYTTRMGICFDYSALLACMLRVQNIPTKLVIGDLLSANQYHAWNQAYIDGQWVLMDATFMGKGYKISDYVQERYY